MQQEEKLEAEVANWIDKNKSAEAISLRSWEERKHQPDAETITLRKRLQAAKRRAAARNK
jgi:hypothetical protein